MMKRKVELTVNQNEVPLNEFAAKALANVLVGFLTSLRDVDTSGEITVKIQPQIDR